MQRFIGNVVKWIAGVMCLINTCTGYPLSVTNGTVMTQDMQRSYVRMFFMPVKAATPEETDLTFHVNYPPLREDFSHVLPDQTQPYNFLGMPMTLSTMDPELIELEESLANATDSFAPSLELLQMTMEKVFNKPRNKLTHPSNRELVGGYIYEKLGRSGLIVAMQDFEHELPLAEYAKVYFDESLASTVEVGTNVIGILPGKYWDTEYDKPIIVGAHWDTVANTTGFDDNGSGVAVLLEIARVLTSSKQHNHKPCFSPDFTVIFVAFDCEEPGSYGSLQFIRKFLSPTFLKKGVTIQGAFILDTIMNVDFLENSQDVPEDWSKLVPGAADSIKKDQQKGNFAAVVGRRHPRELYLNQVLQKWWEQTHQEQGYPYIRPLYFDLENLPYDHNPTPDELLEHHYFWLSDHSRFWYYREDEDDFAQLPALLLTDTAFHRGYMRQCYHRSCDTFDELNVTPLNYFLLQKIARTLIWTISETAMDIRSPLNACLVQSMFAIPKRTPVPVHFDEISIPLTTSTTATTTSTSTTTTTTTQLTTVTTITTTKTTIPEIVGVEQLESEKTNFIQEILDNNSLQTRKDLSQCSGDHCHEEEIGFDSEEVENEIMAHNSLGKFHPEMISLIDNLNHVKGPQINIENLHFDLSTNNIFQKTRDEPLQQKSTPDILLGSGKIDPTILTQIIESFYSNSDDSEKADRRKYKGKHQKQIVQKEISKSPMVIQVKS